MRFVAPGTTQLTFKVNFSSTSNGQSVTGLVAASVPTPILIVREGVSIGTLTITNLASVGAAFSSGGIFEYGTSGDYRLDASISASTGAYSLAGPANSTAGQLIAESIFVNDSTSAMMPALVVTNNDKSGYALTQAFPANFSAMVINTAGQMLLNSTQPAVSFAAFSATAGTLSLTSLVVGAGTVTLNGGLTANITGNLSGNIGGGTVTLATSQPAVSFAAFSATAGTLALTSIVAGAGTLTFNGGIIGNITGGLSGSTGTASNVLLLNGSEPGAALLTAVNAQTSGTNTLTRTASTVTLLGPGAIKPTSFDATCTSSSLVGVLVYGYVSGQAPLMTLGTNAPANWLNPAAFDPNDTSSALLGVRVIANADKTGYALTSPYDAAKTAAQAGDAMTLEDGSIKSATFAASATGQTFGLIAAYDAAKTAATQTSVNAIATILSGITSLAKWLRAMIRRDAADATAKSEINLSGGTYSETASSQQAISVLAGSGGGGGGLTQQQVADAMLLTPTNASTATDTSLYALAEAAAENTANLPGSYTVESTASAPVFTAGVLVNAPSGDFTIMPIIATLLDTELVGKDFVGYQNMAQTVPIAVYDGAGNPVVLTGKTVQFTASQKSTPLVPLIIHDNAGVGGITVPSSANNTAVVSIVAGDTGTVEKLIWGLQDVTNAAQPKALGRGVYDIQQISQKIT